MANSYYKTRSLVIKKIKDNEEIIKKRWFACSNLYTKYTFIDNFLDKDLFNELLKYDLSTNNHFNKYRNLYEYKYYSNHISKEFKLIDQLNKIFKEKSLLKYFEHLFNIPSLNSDPSNYAGGISLMEKNHFLNPHIDNSHLANKKLYRRLNLLFYINKKSWSLLDGGNLEIWNQSVKKFKTILAKGNRLVIMETNLNSWHSVSKIKSSNKRVCLSSYYYSPESPENYDYYHVTKFAGRPNQLILRCIFPIANIFRYFVRKNIRRL